MNGHRHEVAFVTGAGSGTGAAVARRLAARGAAVALFDVSEERVEKTAVAIGADGGRALALQGTPATTTPSDRPWPRQWPGSAP